MLDDDGFVVGVQPGGAGYGDPLSRDPAAVLLDMHRGLVSPGMALDADGVVQDGEVVDEQATRVERDRVRHQRLTDGSPVHDRSPAHPKAGPAERLHPVGDTVEAVLAAGGELVLRCTV